MLKVEVRGFTTVTILFGIIIVIAVVGGVLYLGQFAIKPNFKDSKITPEILKPTSRNNRPPSSPNPLADIPALYPTLSWIPDAEPTLGQDSLFYNNWDYEKDSKKLKDGYASLNGKEWFSEQNIQETEKLWELDSSFEKYYESELRKRGWTWNVYTNGYEIDGAAADGPTGSVWGYMKLDGDKIRTITLRREIIEGNYQKEDPSAPVISCPCKIKFWVFVSDEVPLDNILPQ